MRSGSVGVLKLKPLDLAEPLEYELNVGLDDDGLFTEHFALSPQRQRLGADEPLGLVEAHFDEEAQTDGDEHRRARLDRDNRMGVEVAP